MIIIYIGINAIRNYFQKRIWTRKNQIIVNYL